MKHLAPIVAASLLLLCRCTELEQVDIPAVTADVETTPVHANFMADAADDIAFWIHPEDPSGSLIFGTDKTSGIATYDLQGQELQFLRNGRPNNIDLRTGIFNSSRAPLVVVACSERSRNEILLYRLDTLNHQLNPLSGGKLKSKVPNLYGFCLYHDSGNQQLYAFANSKNGTITQWAITIDQNQRVSGEMVRQLKVRSQPEGMVADDQAGYLYVGEEIRGIWRFAAAPGGSTEGELLAESGRSNPAIRYDIEGLAIYAASDTSGYLLASSQGNNSYAVFDRQPPNQYLGSFRIGTGTIDATSDTDGIEAVSASLGGSFPSGVFIAQDGANDKGGKPQPQNFKLVRWEKIAGVFQPPLQVKDNR